MISSSNFVAIARLVVLARKDPGTTSPFPSLLDLHVVLFNKYSSFNFEHTVVSQKREKHPVPYERPSLR